jgi:hypothetical protein
LIEPDARAPVEQREQKLPAGLRGIYAEKCREERREQQIECAPAKVHATEVGDAAIVEPGRAFRRRGIDLAAKPARELREPAQPQ